MLHFFNTLTRKKELFKPLNKKDVRMYSCGPTVYDYPHIGNLRTYIMVDILKRYLIYRGYKVTHVMNITDVGHLTSDADEGQDKVEEGAKREGKTVWQITDFYTRVFKSNLQKLNIIEPTIWAKATDHITDQIALIKRLESKGYAYETAEAVYFDISKFQNYTKLSQQPLEEKTVGAREEVRVDPGKRNPQDFALWFKLVGKFQNHILHWSSPWGEGFPGWHIECSAMSMKYLGETLDIHIGGIDHIPVHHTNEIAQSEGATGKRFVNYWIHGEHLSVEGKRMAKSAGTFITLAGIEKKGFDPLALRLLVLQAHYRSKLNFTWDSLKAAKESLDYVENSVRKMLGKSGKLSRPNKAFVTALDDDLNTPQALSVFFDVLSQANRATFDRERLYGVLLDMDQVLGLGIARIKPSEIIEVEEMRIKNDTGDELPHQLLDIVRDREKARKRKDWVKADELRSDTSDMGYSIEDGETYITIKKRNI